MNTRRTLAFFLPLICLVFLGASPVTSFAAGAGDSGGIRESIPPRYQKRYQNWKNEFLSTDIGKAQWEMYSKHPRLVLSITIGGNAHGAGTGKYRCTDKAEVVAPPSLLGALMAGG